MQKKKIVYRVRTFLDKYRCIDRNETITLFKCWKVGGLLYGYIDRFNIKTISTDDIISITDI